MTRAQQLAQLQPSFRRRLQALIAACPYPLTITSGYRSPAEQQRLYDAYRAGRGNPANPPGSSEHERGRAPDLGPRAAYPWLAANAGRFGLWRRYPHEPWHIEHDGTPDKPTDDGDLDMSPEQLRTIVREEVNASVAVAIRGGKHHPYHLAAILRTVVAIAKKVGAPLPEGVK